MLSLCFVSLLFFAFFAPSRFNHSRRHGNGRL